MLVRTQYGISPEQGNNSINGYYHYCARGYAVVLQATRGSCPWDPPEWRSEGEWEMCINEPKDGADCLDWIVNQPWCDGNIGMLGGSYLGITQLMAASTKPPHLKALFPIVALYDMYYTALPGGVFYDDFLRTWSELTRQLDTEIVAAPVIGDEDEKMLTAAIEEHKKSRPLIEIFLPFFMSDSVKLD